MNDTDEVQAKLAAMIERRHVLVRALGLVGATAALGACKHLGVIYYPEDIDDRGGDDDGGMGNGGGPDPSGPGR